MLSVRWVLECWNVGTVACQVSGVRYRDVLCWNVGMLECWNVRMLECWNVEMLGDSKVFSSLEGELVTARTFRQPKPEGPRPGTTKTTLKPPALEHSYLRCSSKLLLENSDQ
jgi:hypothetical protein